MSRTDPYWSATIAAAAAERVVKERSLSVLPIDPILLARDLGITVMQKPARVQGVSGMLLRYGNTFGIAYATHIGSIGFQNFSVAHELGTTIYPATSMRFSPIVTFTNLMPVLPQATVTKSRLTTLRPRC